MRNSSDTSSPSSSGSFRNVDSGLERPNAQDRKETLSLALRALIASISVYLASAIALPAFTIIFNRDPWWKWMTTTAILTVNVMAIVAFFILVGAMVFIRYVSPFRGRLSGQA